MVVGGEGVRLKKGRGAPGVLEREGGGVGGSGVLKVSKKSRPKKKSKARERN